MDDRRAADEDEDAVKRAADLAVGHLSAISLVEADLDGNGTLRSAWHLRFPAAAAADAAAWRSFAIGMGAAVGDVALSGFACIWFERVLKATDETYSVWDRNFQLAAWSAARPDALQLPSMEISSTCRGAAFRPTDLVAPAGGEEEEEEEGGGGARPPALLDEQDMAAARLARGPGDAEWGV